MTDPHAALIASLRQYAIRLNKGTSLSVISELLGEAATALAAPAITDEKVERMVLAERCPQHQLHQDFGNPKNTEQLAHSVTCLDCNHNRFKAALGIAEETNDDGPRGI